MPNSIDAEQAVLGALLYDNSCLEYLPDRLKPEHFYEPIHGEMYRRIVALIGQGKLCDGIILHEQIEGFAAYKEIGGLRYLADLMDRAPPGVNAREYANLVFDAALRRGIIRTAQGMIKVASDSAVEDPAPKQIEAAEHELYALVDGGGDSTGPAHLSRGLSGALDMVRAAVDRDGEIAGLSTGLYDLDRKIGGLHPSNLLVLAARPSMGKTSLAVNIGFDVAKQYRFEEDDMGVRKTTRGGVVGFFSLEMSEEELSMRLLSEVTGISGHKMRTGDIDITELGQITDAAVEISEIPFYIDATGGISITKLAARARRMKRTHGLDLIIVDYLQLVSGVEGQYGGRTQEVTQVTVGLKALAKDLGVPVIALSQLSRKVEERDDKRPQLADLRESGSIEQDADAVMFIYREHYYLSRAEPKEGSPEHLTWEDDLQKLENVAEVIIGKQRHGPIGTVKLAWNGDTTKFSNLPREHRMDFD